MVNQTQKTPGGQGNMNCKRAVVDASSAILLFKAGLFGHLVDAYRVVVARAVYGEICRDGYPGARRFAAARKEGQMRVFAPDPEKAALVRGVPPGRGERETILLFAQGAGDFVLIDDRRGAGCCRSAGIPYINALLLPKILMFAGRLSESQCRRRTSQLLAGGRYSKKIVAVAAAASPQNLFRFMPR